MKKSRHGQKNLVIVIISSLIVLGVIPSITADVERVLVDSEMIEITIQIFGINRGEEHTVQLTWDEAKLLENLIENIRSRLDNAEAREQRVQIFNEAIVELDRLDLLPDGISVDETQQLVTSRYQNSRVLKFYERAYNRNPFNDKRDSNFLCLIAGNTSYTFFTNRFNIISSISFGTFKAAGYGFKEFHSYGWVWTDGLFDVQNWTGPFIGGIYPGIIPHFHYEGVIGFRGIVAWYKPNQWIEKACFLGSALWAKIRYV